MLHMQEVCGAIAMFFAPSKAIRQRFIDFGVAPERIQLAPYGIEPHKRSDRSRSTGTAADRLRRQPDGLQGATSRDRRVRSAAAVVRPRSTFSVRMRRTTATTDIGERWRSGRATAASGSTAACRTIASTRSFHRSTCSSCRRSGPRPARSSSSKLWMPGSPVVASSIGGIPESCHRWRQRVAVQAGRCE